MRDLVIHYRPRGPWWSLKRTSLRRDLPDSWSELPAARRLRVLRTLVRTPDPFVARMGAVKEALSIPNSLWQILAANEIIRIMELLPFLTADPSPTPMVDVVGYKGQTYAMPKSNFENGSCIEYPLADEYLMQFINTSDALPLRRLCAVLLREVNTNVSEGLKVGDMRMPLHSRAEVEARAAHFAALPNDILIATMLYFVGVKQLIVRLYGSWLFNLPDPDAEPDTELPKVDSLGWWGMYMDASGGDPTKLEAIQQSNFHNFCLSLVRQRKAVKEAAMQSRLNSPDFGQPESIN